MRVCQRAPRFTWSSPYPHFPPLQGVYYTSEPPKARHTKALDDLINRFTPATPLDRQLLRAAVMTLYWGGPSGRRPSFVITSQGANDKMRGCGVGKTTLVEMLSRLVGGYISVRMHTSQDRILSGLLAPTSWPMRICFIDNLKTYRFSSDLIESLVTCTQINGHRLHHGFATRPNLLTWMVSVNGASFSKDMSERSIVIFLRRPVASGTWYIETTQFIEENRDRIVADVRWHLERQAPKIEKMDRWADWVQEVLSRVENPVEVLKELTVRRKTIDEDDQDPTDVIEHIRACLRATLPRTSPDTVAVRIPSLLLGQWLRKLKSNLTDRQASQYLQQLQSPRLTYQRTSKHRGYVWRGEEAGPDAPLRELTYRIEKRGE